MSVSVCVVVVQGRLYRESMSGARTTKEDEEEVGRLEEQEYWLGIVRAKLMMDLIFVCESRGLQGGKREADKRI